MRKLLNQSGYSWVLATVLAFACAQASNSQSPSLAEQIERIPGVESVEVHETSDGDFESLYHITIRQPLDHRNPASGSFLQHLYLGHKGVANPVVLETNGYWVSGFDTLEVSELLGGNQIRVEHRYYGASIPDSLNWSHLNLYQTTEDLHRITELFKSIYLGPWVSYGRSKGGETAIAYRYRYPDDVDVTFAFVAPLILSREDPRVDRYIETRGTVECRNLIRSFQRASLQRRDELLPIIASYADSTGTALSIGVDVAFEYAVLEFPFSFWQWGDGDCSRVPMPNASPNELAQSILDVSGLYLYSDKGIERYLPSFYQHLNELGYYGFVFHHLSDLLEAVPNPDNAVFGPQGVDIPYRKETIQSILNWATEAGDQIVYLYGENDPWTGAAVHPHETVDAFRLLVPGANHGVQLADLTTGEKEDLRMSLERWLGIAIDPF